MLKHYLKYDIYIILILLLLNKNIKSSPFPSQNIEDKKEYISRAYNLTSLGQLDSFLKHNKQTFVYFYSNFCSGCKELLNAFNKASSYEMVFNSSNILLVNCNNYQELCFKFEIETLPYLKIYYYHSIYKNISIINHKFYSFEFNDIIKLIQKVTNSGNNDKYKGLIKLKSQKEINKFSNTFGDVSFLLILDKNNKMYNKNLLSCYNNDIALSPLYITKFYFGYTYNTKIKKQLLDLNVKLPLIYMTGINYNDFNLHYEIETCNDIKQFINNNELPIFRNFDSKYLFKLLRMKKTIFIFNIDKQKLSSLPRLISSIQKTLLERRDLVFGYLDINEDISMLSFFKINTEVLSETIIVYDFKKGKYHLEKYEDKESIEKLINDYDNGRLNWKSGYFIEDFLSSLGFEVNRNILILIIMGIFSIFVIIGCIFCFQTFEKIDRKLR